MSTPIATYRVLAHNYAVDSENKIHSDDVAARYGFKGGLVPGVADFAYLARAVFDVWGEPWLSGGTVEAKLMKPLYHGETVQACAFSTDIPGRLRLELANEPGEVCATGEAGLDDAQPPPRTADYPRADPPALEDRREPTIDDFSPGVILGAYEYVFDAAATARGAAEMFGARWPSASGWDPVMCLHDANRTLRANVKLGPWIHTMSRLELYATPADREHLSLRGRVIDTSEKRGHVMTRVDLALFAAERPIARITHGAIIRLAA